MKWWTVIKKLGGLGGESAAGGVVARLKANRLATAVIAGLAVLALTYVLTNDGGIRAADTRASADAGVPAGTGPSRVGALGRIEPESEIIDIGGPTDERVATLLVKEGDRVTKGQTLGYFKSHAQRAAEADRIAAKLKETEVLLDAETRAGEAAIHEAEIRVQRTKETYPLRIRGQEAKIRRVEAELVNNRDILASRKELRAKEYQSRRSVDDQHSLVRQNEENLKSEREVLDRLKAEMRLEALSAQAALQRARADLARAQAAAGVESMREELAVAKARAAESVIMSPIDGQILKILTRAGERIGDKAILKMGNTSQMHVVAEVYETDIGRVGVGQRATVTSRALAKPLTGKVVKIGHMIFKNDVLRIDPAAKVDARIVEVRVLLDDSAAAADLTNLTVDVVIEVDDEKPTDSARDAKGS